MKMFIDYSCDSGLLGLNMRIKANYAGFDMELTNHDFETQVERHEEISKFEEVVEKSVLVN